jgi:hypothetical protein
MMDENFETNDENMKNEMTHSSIVQVLEILKLCNFLRCFAPWIVAKILGESIIPIGQIWSTQPDRTQP